MRKKAIAFISYTFLFIMATFIAIFFSVAVPVMGLTYHDIYIDFSDHIVNDFDDIPIVLNENTFGLSVYGSNDLSFNYKMSSCPAGIEQKDILINTRLTKPDNTLIHNRDFIFKLPCSTTYQTYTYGSPFFVLNDESKQTIKNLILGVDSEYLRINETFFDSYNNLAYNGITIYLQNYEIRTQFYAEFNTTYYFDHIALDSLVYYLSANNITLLSGGSPSGNSNVYLLVAYDSSDYYRIYNTDTSYTTTRGRVKYNVPIGERITAYGIGIGTYAVAEYNSAYYLKSIGAPASSLVMRSLIYTLNYSNTQQSFPGTTMPDLEYQTCAVWDIPCHLGNAITYIALDLPITSDIYGLFSKGFQVVSNGLYVVTGIFGANFNIDGLISGNFFSITLIISLGVLIVIMMVGGGDDDD